MKIEKFNQICEEELEGYYNQLIRLNKSKIDSGELEIGYCNIGKCYRSRNNFYMYELSGLEISNFSEIKIKRHSKILKTSNIQQFFYHSFPDKHLEEPKLKFTETVSGGTFILAEDISNFETKVKLPLGPKIINKDWVNKQFPITGESDFYFINDISIIRHENGKTNFRFIPFAIICHRKINESRLTSLIQRQLNNSIQSRIAPGIYSSTENGILSFCKQLISLSNEKVDETLIDKIIVENKKYFLLALGYKDFIAQARLKWENREEDEPEISIPDYILVREDDTFDILDLKTGAIKYKSITKTRQIKSRPRFVDYVDELASQLEVYKDYFKYNSHYAKVQYGIECNYDDINLIGVVGNHNNYKKNEVDRVLRNRADLSIISFTDIANTLLSKLKV